MRTIPAIAALAISLSANAQDISVKLYANATTAPFTSPFTNTYYGLNYRNGYKEMVSPSVAFTFKNKRKNYHEVEWSRFKLNTEERSRYMLFADTNYYQNTQRIISASIAVRYEYIINLVKNKKYILQPSLGFAAMPYYNLYKAMPFISSDYPTSQSHIGVKHFIVPRVNINLSKRLYFDMNVPVCVLDMGVVRQNIQNPTLASRAQKYSIADAQAFNYYSVRMGLGFRF